MSKLISQYATFAEYMAACDSDSSRRVAHYAEVERQAAEEAQMRRDAERYRDIRRVSTFGRNMTDEQFDAEIDAALAGQ